MSMSAFLTLTVIKQVSVALRKCFIKTLFKDTVKLVIVRVHFFSDFTIKRPKDIQNFKKYRQKNRLDTKTM